MIRFKGCKQLSCIDLVDFLSGGFEQQLLYRRAFIHKQADIALRFSQRQGLLMQRKRNRDIALCLLNERLQDPDFDGASHPSARFSGFQETAEQRRCILQR